jgi:hypothetical protein
MGKWVVLVKTTEGTQTIVLEADSADKSDDGKDIHFANFGTLVEVYEAFESIKPELTWDEKKAAVHRLLRALSRFSVGSFKADSVVGYYQDEGAKLG